MLNGQFIKFLAVGGTGAAVNIAARFGLNLFMTFDVAIVIAYVAGMVTTFVLSRAFVFTGAAGSPIGQALRFTLVNGLAICLVWAVSVSLARGLFPAMGFDWYAQDIAHIIGVLSTAVSSYLMHRYFTFAS